jgi:prephenate dehydrogenase
MAGREAAGFANAEHGIFRGRTWFVDDSVALSEGNRRRLEWLLAKTGAVQVRISSDLHDDLIAELSHLPQLVSTILGAQIEPGMLELAGPGMRSMLRLAGSPYAVWNELIDRNRENVVEALTVFRDNLNAVLDMIEKRRPLRDVFAAAARSYRCLS